MKLYRSLIAVFLYPPTYCETAGVVRFADKAMLYTVLRTVISCFFNGFQNRIGYQHCSRGN